MNPSEYNYRKSGKPATRNEENYAFANDRLTDCLRTAEMDRQANAVTQAPAINLVKVISRSIGVVLNWFGTA